MFGAIRLARFNVNLNSFEKDNYSGLPIPSMAVTISTYVLFSYDLWEGLRFAPLLVPLVILLSILMVSNVEYETIPRISFRENKKNTIQLLIMAICLGIIIIFREKVMFPLVLGFVLMGLFRSLFRQDKEDEEEDEVLDVYMPD
jgi:CDP-diacylglycerol--serine O-phosphatidyltransferase